MHVAVIADSPWLEEELAGFKGLVVGLLDEQVGVTQVVPEGSLESDTTVFGQRVYWREATWPFLQRRRLRALSEALAGSGVNIVHATSGRVWDGAIALAAEMESALVLAIHASRDTERLPKAVEKVDPQRLAVVATTTPIAEAVRTRLGTAATVLPSEETGPRRPTALVEVVAPGVHVPEQPVARRTDPEAMCAVVSGTGVYDPSYEALFTALRAVVDQRPLTQFFFDGQAADQHYLWQAARRHNLLSNISLVPRRLGPQRLLMGADVLIQPQPLGRSRSLTLQAMAEGIPIIAASDPAVDYLIDGETAWVLDHPTADGWQQALARLTSEPDAVATLIERARAHVARRHLVSHRVTQFIKTYRVLTNEMIPLRG